MAGSSPWPTAPRHYQTSSLGTIGKGSRHDPDSAAVNGKERGDVDDGVPATLGGTGDPDSIDMHPMDLTTVTQLSDRLHGQVQESISRSLFPCYTKEDWVKKQDEDISCLA